MISRIKSHLNLLLGVFLLTGLCLARESDGPEEKSAGWVVGVVIGSMVFLCVVIVIVVCCVCKKSVSKDILIRPAETVDRDAYGLNKSVFHVEHMPHHHHHHHHHTLNRGVHYDHNGHVIGQDSGHVNQNVDPGHVQSNGMTSNVQIPSISVSYHSPEVTMDYTSTAQGEEAQAGQSGQTPLSDNSAETIPPENT